MADTEITFSYKGRQISGLLSPVFGSGEESGSIYHLMVDNFYWGRLRKISGKWLFDPTPKTGDLVELADYFGSCVRD